MNGLFQSTRFGTRDGLMGLLLMLLLALQRWWRRVMRALRQRIDPLLFFLPQNFDRLAGVANAFA